MLPRKVFSSQSSLASSTSLAMAPTPTSPVTQSTTTLVIPIEPHAALPGIKRGIAIGAACSITILLIALLAFFAFRHRRRTPTTDRLSQKNLIESCQVQQMCWRYGGTTKSESTPVTTSARTVHELDANDTSRGAGAAHEPMQDERRFSWEQDDNMIYMPAAPQGLFNTGSPTRHTAGYQDRRKKLPTVFVIPPEESREHISPVMPMSPLPHSHTRYQRHRVS